MTDSDTHTQFESVPQLFRRGLVQAPLTLRCFVNTAKFADVPLAAHSVNKETHLKAPNPKENAFLLGDSRTQLMPLEAALAADGSVTFLGETFPDIEAARIAAQPHGQSTSTAWQFWLYFNEARGAWAPLEHLRAELAQVLVHGEARERDSEIKSSQKHPLRIDSVAYPEGGGDIGMTLCPGKRAQGLYGGTWARDLRTDLNAIAAWQPLALISLMEQLEFDLLEVGDFPDLVAEQIFQWLSVPIPDMQIPGAEFERQWLGLAPGLHSALRHGGRVVLHCRGGLGRTGLVAARLLIDAGLRPPTAIRRVREARIGAIETYLQEYYLLTRAWAG